MIPEWNMLTHAIEQHGIERLKRYVAQESVSRARPRPVPVTILRMHDMIYEDLRAIPRANAQSFATSSYPVVTAAIPASRQTETAPWLLLYTMADTRPIGAKRDWVTDPLSCQTTQVEGQRRVIGRGVFNSKSALAGTVDVCQLLAKWQHLPVNVMLITDFEEAFRRIGVEALRVAGESAPDIPPDHPLPHDDRHRDSDRQRDVDRQHREPAGLGPAPIRCDRRASRPGHRR
jgi:acetylornithine deacetylase/succinyl-diaminopimelate desuccinylase-like protein